MLLCYSTCWTSLDCEIDGKMQPSPASSYEDLFEKKKAPEEGEPL